jgi:sterol desaturase/sphingolipid hydroxylase (fatty acid hydroxylase superfamily)
VKAKIMEQTNLIVQNKGAIVLAFLLLFLLLERIIPFAKTSKKIQRIGTNIALASLNAGLSIFFIVPMLNIASHNTFTWRPEWLSGVSGLSFDVVVLDLWIYWWHRAVHVIPFLWRFHEVHHLDETLDASSALRFHFGEVLISALVRAPFIIALEIPLTNVLLFETIVACATIFHHSNLRLPAAFERMLSRMIVTPSIHWVHHHARQVDTDSNYAVFFSIWDRLFKSQSRSVRTVELVIGVEGEKDQKFFKLISRPITKSAK